MITIGVCDDNIQFARLLVKSLRTLCATELPERIGCQIAVEFSSCDDVLRYLEYNTINILFLDINMPTKTGFDLAEKLNQLYPDIIIIFVSAHDNFVYSSFEYSPFRFLRKTHLYKDRRDDGINISSGEAQKIARALYKDSPFIILDEPTAALDPIAEAEIYSKFNDIVGDRTAIYISHRLSSCRFCDEIAVFDNGQVVQMGNHDSLVEEYGLYRELWYAQAQYYTE